MRSCIILCGGISRRMGQDKGLMLLEGQPMILHIIKTLECAVDKIILVLRNREQLNHYRKVLDDVEIKVKFFIDLKMDQGPLIGLLTGLSNLESDGALILPCDSPYVSIDFIDEIFTLAEEEHSQAVVPSWPDGSLEPLHAYYRKECIPIIIKMLSEGLRDFKSLLKKLNVRYIDVARLDPNRSSFTNLNYPHDILEQEIIKKNLDFR
jgi:molybdenum cofactor guanylyltransferase